MPEQSEKKIKAVFEIIIATLESKRAYFKTAEQMKGIIKRKTKSRESRLKKDFSIKENDYFLQIAQVLSQRDEKISNELCHLTRNRSITLGGFSRRIHRLSKGMLRKLNIVSKLEDSLREIEKDAKIIHKEAKLAERTLGNKVNKNNKKRRVNQKG